MAYEITEIKKIGIGLIGFGLFFTFLGIILFFDRGLLALGNIFSLAGVGILLGWRSTWALFTNRANFKALFSPSLFITKFISFCNETLSPANVLFEWMPLALPFLQGSASFLLGLFFIFVRWPIVGIILEIYGCVFLFSGFWSSIKVFLYHIPVVGWIIQFISRYNDNFPLCVSVLLVNLHQFPPSSVLSPKGCVAILQYIILLVFLGIDHYVLLSKIDDYSVAGVILVLLRFSTSLMLATHKG
ncbi:Vesicle transport protein GOT1 isoform A [Glycine soja]|uniref:Vesicle transport protein GOT1 isoform A n=1 Tax=Glycine soja TaxID=3848 RepID=A0A445FZG9_GLYSO|nr:Vesicle transport protein GOT1 isoform A [Glycine soja]